MTRPIQLALSPRDRAVLEKLKEALDANASEVLRWALRHYALTGPVPRHYFGDESAIPHPPMVGMKFWGEEQEATT